MFSLLTPRFFIRNKRHKGRGTFFEKAGGGGNSLKRTYVEGGRGVHVKRTGTNKRVEGGSKTGSFKQTYFLNDPI